MIWEKDLPLMVEALQKDEGNYKRKRIMTVVLGLLSAFIVSVAFKNYFFGVTLVLISLGLFKWDYYSLQQDFNRYAAKRQLSFVSFLGYVMAFLENKMNVYQSFQKSKDYVDPLIEFDLRQLVDEINNDKSPQPYIHFADKYKSTTVNQIMLLLYQLEQNGFETTTLNQFIMMMNHLQENTTALYVKEENQRLNWYYGFPFISTVLLTTLFAFGVLEQVVYQING